MSRVLVCGSRWIEDAQALYAALAHARPDVVISGAARGPDLLAAKWARHTSTPLIEFPADWNKHGRAAGPIRNQQMLDEARPTLCLAFWDGESSGTFDMIRRCVCAGVEVRIVPAQAPKDESAPILQRSPRADDPPGPEVADV